ncbi:hypothetical protein [uncultured Cellulomonas sp.]|uniref:hypothetical protein n=1 Tax=uncultured Cellulomonas sp. TaxID=189682 RepID=UPI002608FBED|nr:hypothetical protein [uncultured Cellulomonas sp.]
MATVRRTPATTSNWLAATAMIAAAMMAGGWFLAIGPRLAEAADTRTDAASVEERNLVLDAQLTALEQQDAELPALESELVTLQAQLPPDARLPALLDELSALADTHAVTLLAVTPGTPTAVAPSEAAPAAAVADGAASTEPAADATTDPVAEQTAPATTSTTAAVSPIPGFVAVPVQLTALGATDDVLAFLEALQTTTTRLLLVTALTGTGQPDAEPAGGRPATRTGDVEMRVDGLAYVLVDHLAVAPTPQPEASGAPVTEGGTAGLTSASSGTVGVG